MRRVGFGTQGEVGIFSGNLWALSQGGAGSEAMNVERVLFEHGLSPEVRDPAPERAPPGKSRSHGGGDGEPRYGPQVLSILAAIWEAAGYPWSVRLKALLPSWMPWIRKRYRMTSATEKQLLGISARQIDRRLRERKSERKRRIYGHTKSGLTVEALHPGEDR